MGLCVRWCVCVCACGCVSVACCVLACALRHGTSPLILDFGFMSRKGGRDEDELCATCVVGA